MKHRATGWGRRGLEVEEAPGSQPDSCPESSCTPFTCQHPSSTPAAPGAPALAHWGPPPSSYTFRVTVPPSPGGPHTLSS